MNVIVGPFMVCVRKQYIIYLFMETAVTPERKVEKSFPTWEINCHAEGEKWVID